jgi:hypothetical protein
LIGAIAFLLVTACVAPLATTSAEAAADLAIRQRCRAMAERIWPSGTGDVAQYNRNRRFLVLGCLNNGGNIPD